MYNPRLPGVNPRVSDVRDRSISQKFRPTGWNGLRAGNDQSAWASRRATRAWPSALGVKVAGAAVASNRTKSGFSGQPIFRK